jgi:hypothetical protein
MEGDHSTPNRTPQPLDKEGSNIKGHIKLGDKNENGNKVTIGRIDAPMKGKDQGKLDVEDSSRGNANKGEEYAGIKGNKALEEINMGHSAHSTLSRSSIPTEDIEVEIMGKSPSTEKNRDSSIRIEVGSVGSSNKSQTDQEQV